MEHWRLTTKNRCLTAQLSAALNLPQGRWVNPERRAVHLPLQKEEWHHLKWFPLGHICWIEPEGKREPVMELLVCADHLQSRVVTLYCMLSMALTLHMPGGDAEGAGFHKSTPHSATI